MSALTYYTNESFPLAFDFTPTFQGVGSRPASLPGDSLATGSMACSSVAGMTATSWSIGANSAGTSNMVFNVLYSASTVAVGAGAQVAAQIEVTVKTANGRTLSKMFPEPDANGVLHDSLTIIGGYC